TLLAAWLIGMRVASVLLNSLLVLYLGLLAHRCPSGRDAGPASLFPATIMRSKTLWIVAALAAAITLALDLLSNSMGLYARAAAWSSLGLYFLFVKILSLLAMMALWLAPSLVVLHGAGPL
ncbi:MAG: hypothetical protein WKG03_13460, partial [Telluria sp.]